MELKLKEGWTGTRSKVIVFVLTVVISVISALLMTFGLFLVPLMIAAFVLLFILEQGKKKVFSIVASSLSIILDFVFNGIFSASALTAVLAAFIIYLSLTRGFFTKGEAALAVTALISVIIAVLLIFAAFYIVGTVDIALALDYYSDLTDNMREIWISTMEEHIAKNPNTEFSQIMTPEVTVAVFDSCVNMLFSVIGILAFLLTGLAFKLLSALLSLFLVDKKQLSGWSFSLSRIFGYFYLGLYVLRIFLSGTDVASLVVLNLMNVFMFIFAYIGFKLACSVLSIRMKNKSSAALIVIFACILFYSFAISVLSFLGVFAAGLKEKLSGDDTDFV